MLANITNVLLGKRECWSKTIKFQNKIFIVTLEEYIPENRKAEKWKDALCK